MKTNKDTEKKKERNLKKNRRKKHLQKESRIKGRKDTLPERRGERNFQKK